MRSTMSCGALVCFLGLVPTARAAEPAPSEPASPAGLEGATPETPAPPALPVAPAAEPPPVEAPDPEEVLEDARHDVEPPPLRRPRFEVGLGSEPTWLSARRMGQVTASRAAATGSMRFGYRIDNRFTVMAGYRGGGDLFVTTGRYDASTRFHGFIAGARVAEPLGRWFEVAAELEAELLAVRTTFELDGAAGSGGGHALGLTPRVGLGVTIPLGHVVALQMRLLAGYALRTATALDDVVLDVPGAAASAPRDFGSVDLSGLQLAFHLGLAF
jgi:hypothetical protein